MKYIEKVLRYFNTTPSNMFSELVDSIERMAQPIQDFLSADNRVRKLVVATAVRAGTISAMELEKLIVYNIVAPSADLCAVAILADRPDLSGAVMLHLKHGWDLVPTLFELSRIFDASTVRNARLFVEVCRRLEQHGAGVRMHGAMHCSSAAELRSVRWRTRGQVQLSTDDITKHAWSNPKFRPEGAQCVVEPSTEEAAYAVGKFRSVMIARADHKIQQLLSANGRPIDPALTCAKDWTAFVALRRTSRPDHTRFFTSVEAQAMQGRRSAAVAAGMFEVYLNQYPGSYTPAVVVAGHPGTVEWSRCRLTTATFRASMVEWGGVLHVAYNALRCFRIDWFVCAIRMLARAPNAEADGKRIGLAVSLLLAESASAFMRVVVGLLVVIGHGVDVIDIAARTSPVSMANMVYVRGRQRTSEVIAAIAYSDAASIPVLYGLVRDGVVDQYGLVPDVFRTNAYGRPIGLHPQAALMVTRLRLPVVHSLQRLRLIAAGASMIKRDFPAELVSIILSFVVPLPSPSVEMYVADMPLTFIRTVVF